MTRARPTLIAFLLAVLPVRASAQLQIDWYTVDGGGGVASNGSLNMIGTIGQADAGGNLTGPGGLTMNTGFWYGGPAAALHVELDYLEATSAGAGEPVVVRWGTAAEVNNGGFRVYRALPDGNGGYLLADELTTSLIAAQGAPGQGAEYEFVDGAPYDPADAAPRAYYLQDIDLGGRTTLHGPAVLDPSRVIVAAPFSGMIAH
jgi:hypothetical protein